MTVSCLECDARGEGRLCDLPAALLERFDRIKQALAVPAGETLFQEGETPSGIFLLRSGSVRLAAASPDGSAAAVRRASTGDVLGLSATVSGRPYEATAKAMDRCQVCFVKRRDFIRFSREDRRVCLRVVSLLGEETYAAYQRVRSARSGRSTRGRRRKRERPPRSRGQGRRGIAKKGRASRTP